MSLLTRVGKDIRFLRDATRAYAILRKVRAEAELTLVDLVEDRIAAAPHRLAILFEGRMLEASRN